MQKEGITIIKEAFKYVLESSTYDKDLINKYFHPNYVQYVDGKQIDGAQFHEHIKAQKKVIKNISTSFKSIIQQNDIVFSNHVVKVAKNDNSSVTTHVIAEFRLKDNLIHYCDELTHMIEGSEKDKDLGSRVE